MTPVFLIGMFTIAVAFMIYWMQIRQDRLDSENVRSPGRKTARTVKIADYEKVAKIDPLKNEEDIATLPGVGPMYEKLLKLAEYETVGSIVDLEPSIIQAKLLEVNEKEAVTKRPPSLKVVEGWVEAAKSR